MWTDDLEINISLSRSRMTVCFEAPLHTCLKMCKKNYIDDNMHLVQSPASKTFRIYEFATVSLLDTKCLWTLWVCSSPLMSVACWTVIYCQADWDCHKILLICTCLKHRFKVSTEKCSPFGRAIWKHPSTVKRGTKITVHNYGQTSMRINDK